MQKMISKMARMYPMFILVGFMLVVAALVIGYFNSQTAAAYFAQPKTLRETTLMAQRASIARVDQWLPYFKFLGLGMILSGIVMALRVIIENLQAAGRQVMENLPPAKRPATPPAPWYGLLMPMVMMLGLLLFIVALVVSLNLASIAGEVFANPIPAIDAAGPGSTLLNQVQLLHTTNSWLVPLKFFAIATEFLAIVMGLSTIIYILRRQTEMIQQGINLARSMRKTAQREQAAA
jgi:hypothetical protein